MFRIVEIVVYLVEAEGCDIDQGDIIINTPLVLAACYGDEEVVKILLGRGDVNPNKSDNGGKTPLGCAAQNGHA